MNIFIDSNVFVTFFEMSQESLSALEKLLTVLKTHEATLWLPEHTKREFWKNRDKQILKVLASFAGHSSIGSAPLLAREHPDFKELNQVSDKASKLRQRIATQVREDVDGQRTAADAIIRKLFEHARAIDTDSPTLFDNAHRRALCHLPPGKKADLGDRLAWVALLSSVPNNAALHIISDDSDFETEGRAGEIRSYLAKEWTTKNGGTAKLWKRISQFLAANFRDAANAMELERVIVATQLRSSGSFAATHALIKQLEQLGELSDEPLRLVVEALLDNSQVRSIRYDEDVESFYRRVLERHRGRLDSHLASTAEELLQHP